MFLPCDRLRKGIPVNKLRMLLDSLPDDIVLTVNQVGNLTMMSEVDWMDVGYINFLTEETVFFGDE